MAPKKFTAKFSSIIKVLTVDEKDKYLTKASIDALKSIIPDYFTTQQDLLPIAFNSCAVNRVNKNYDVIDTATAIAINKSFNHKFINAEHDRSRVIGHIVNSAYSKFDESYSIGVGSEILSEEQVKNLNEPFNMCLAGVIYKVVIGPQATDYVMQCADPNSASYLQISASFELAFDDFDIAIGNKNLAECEIVTDIQKKMGYYSYLAAFGGPGKLDDGRYVYRLINQGVVPLGVGLTTSPAADVKGVVTTEPLDDPNDQDEDDPIMADNKNIAKTDKITVTNNIDLSNTNMENKDKQLEVKEFASYDEMETALASEGDVKISFNPQSMRKLFADKLAEVTQKHATEVKAKEDEAKAKADEITAFNTQVAEMTAKIETFEAAELARVKAEALATRLSELSAGFELDEAQVKAITKQIADLDAEAFASWKTDFEVFAAKSKKAAPKVDKEDLKDGGADENKEDKNGKMKAKAEAAASVLDTAKVDDKETLPNNIDDKPKTLTEKMAAAFSFDKCVIKTSK